MANEPLPRFAAVGAGRMGRCIAIAFGLVSSVVSVLCEVHLLVPAEDRGGMRAGSQQLVVSIAGADDGLGVGKALFNGVAAREGRVVPLLDVTHPRSGKV